MSVAAQFLADLTAQRMPVTIFLLNGVKLQGHILESDEKTLLLKRENMTQLVFQHAISTILPLNPL